MGTARHEHAVGGSVFEGKFREPESPGLSRGSPNPACRLTYRGALLELDLLLLKLYLGGYAIRGAARLRATLSAVHPRTSGLRTWPAGGIIRGWPMPVRRPLFDAGTLCSRMRYPAFVISAKPIGTIPWTFGTVGLSIGFSPCCQSSLAVSLADPLISDRQPLKSPHSVWPSG